MIKTKQEYELCRENVARNIVNVAIGEPLDIPLSELNKSCEFRKAWDKFAGKDREAKAKMKAYYQRPEVKTYRKLYMKVYRQKPEVKAKRKAYDKTYSQRPKVKARIKAYKKAYYQKKKLGETK